MIIRTMTPSDYAAVLTLWQSTPGMGLNDLDDSEEGIRRFLGRNPTTCFVAVEDGAPIGVILCGHDGRRGHLYHLAVVPAHRRRGIGRRLVDTAMDALAREGIHKAALVVFTKNDMGNDFWASIGFTTREDLVYRNKQIREFTPLYT